jgi:hypothetical protein
MLRPPVATDRLHLTDDGRVRLSLRHPWSDGTTDLVLTPLELLERLSVLVPRPRINLILYFGVLGARAAARAEVVGRRIRETDHAPTTDAAQPVAASGDPAESAGGPNRSWATLMQRTFGLDVLACPRCGGRLRLIALIEGATVIARILGHLGLPTEVPRPQPARSPPETWFDESMVGDQGDVFTPAS